MIAMSAFRALVLFVCLLLLWPMVACGATAAPSASAAQAPKAAETHSRGFFYEIPGKQATVFLLGSVHVGKKDFYPLDAPIESAFERAHTLVLEIDLSEKSRLNMMNEALSAAFYPEGESIDQHLDEQTLALLTDYLREKNLPFERFKRFRPWMAAMTITLLEMQGSGFVADEGIDLHFAKRAKDKKIVGIETAEEQLGLFLEMNEDTQVLMLKQMLETRGEVGETIEQAAQAWLAGDEVALERQMLEPLQAPEYRPVFQHIFVDRNVKMTRAIEDFLNGKGTYFVVVGAGHVIGKEGIVERLKSKNYDVLRR